MAGLREDRSQAQRWEMRPECFGTLLEDWVTYVYSFKISWFWPLL